MKKVLILGGAGFIGSHLCLKLVEKGYNVSVLDSLNKQVHGEEYTNSFLYQMIQGKVDLHIAKMQDEKLLLALLRENDIVVHLASETGTAQSMYRVKQYTEVNIGSISTLLDTLINNETRVKKVFLASSRAVYGEGRYQNEHGQAIFPNIRNKGDLENGQFDLLSKENRKRLTMRPNTENCQINPISVYGFSKYAQEQLLKITAQTYGIDFCVLRFQNVFGPGQSLLNSYTGVLNVFASRAILNKPLDIFEDGKGIRDFIYIDDAVDATVLAIENEQSSNETFNVGTGVGTTILDAALSISKCLDKEVICNISGHYRYGDIRHSLADIGAISDVLGFMPKYSFEKGLQLFIKWVQSQDVRDESSDLIFNENLKKGVLRIKNK